MKYKMEDALECIIDYRGKTPHKSDTGIPTLSAKSVKNGYIDYSECYYISEDEYARFMVRGFPQVGDILLTTEAPMGMVARLDRDDVGIAQRLITLRGKKGILDNNYLMYYLQSPIGQGKLREKETGSTVTGIKQTEFRKIEIDVPDIEQQRKISSILYGLDRKIECNKAINRNLEEQMQAIFGSIFYPEMSAGNRVSLGDYLYIKGRIGWKGLKKEEYLEESEYRIINGESLTATGIDWSKAGYISEERYMESSEIMLHEGDILISKDGTIGKIGYVDRLEKPASVASGIFVVRNLKPEEISTVFVYCLFNSDYFKSFITSRTEGSVIPHLYQKDFVTLEIPLLSKEQVKVFDDAVQPMFRLYFINQNENLRLERVRNAILPKLMSGELDVSNINM